MTRNGKIARLPLAVRQQLNQRLQNGDLAQDLLSCLLMRLKLLVNALVNGIGLQFSAR
jgi:hypothetical protein